MGGYGGMGGMMGGFGAQGFGYNPLVLLCHFDVLGVCLGHDQDNADPPSSQSADP